MSTYLLAFVVCDFDFIGNETEDGVLVIITIYTYICATDNRCGYNFKVTFWFMSFCFCSKDLKCSLLFPFAQNQVSQT